MKNKILFIGVIATILLSAFVIAQITSSEETTLSAPKLYLSLGDYFLKQGKSDLALKMYERSLILDPNNILTLNNLGYYYKDINPLLAEDYFKKALQIDPDYELARNNLALLYNSLENYEQAAYHLKILLEDFPDNINYNYDYAINMANKFYYITKQYDDLSEALKYFKIVYNMDPGFEHVMDNIKVLNEIENMY